MTRSRRTEHLGPDDGRPQYTEAPLCGAPNEVKYASRIFSRTSDPGGSRTCGACQALHYGKILAEQFPTLTITNAKGTPDGFGYSSGSAYRGIHAVHIGGVLRGYVTSEHGFGKGFTVHRATNRENLDGAVTVETYEVECPTGRIYAGTPESKNAAWRVERAATSTSFGSKEHAAYAMALRILSRALTGWTEFEPPMEPAAYMAHRAAEAKRRTERKEAERQQTVADMTTRTGELEAERELILQRLETLRSINVEADAQVEALVWARGVCAKELDRVDDAIHSAKVHKQRAEEGREI